VVNGRRIAFVYHHTIGDGLSGYAFHRSLLAALNADDATSTFTQAAITEQGLSVVDVPVKEPPPHPMTQIPDKLSWLHVIYGFLFWTVTRFFLSSKYFLFSDAVFSKAYPTATKPFPLKDRTITKVEIMTIENEVMRKCLDACRKHKTSFTALLHTLIQITLASDIYPNAKIGFSRLAVNIRPLLKVNPGPNVFLDAVSTYCRVQWLGKYRAAASDHSVRKLNGENPSASKLQVDGPLLWKLASQYKSCMSEFIYKNRMTLQDYLTGKLLGEDDEETGKSFYGLGLYQNYSFLVSNLGAFAPREDMIDDKWSVENVEFSAAATRAALGDVGIVFNVASVMDGECVICATYEDGVLRGKMVRRVLDGVLERLRMLV
jgi:hypothetical protein